jgi:putative membrane protein
MALYLWVKALHIIFVVSWFAGLLYLPRLFVYHAMTEDRPGRERFQVMERKLFGIMTIAGLLAAAFGITMLVLNPALLKTGWMHAKLALIVALIAYHGYCYRIVGNFRADREARSHVWFRWFNEAPAVMLIAVVLLAVLKPF